MGDTRTRKRVLSKLALLANGCHSHWDKWSYLVAWWHWGKDWALKLRLQNFKICLCLYFMFQLLGVCLTSRVRSRRQKPYLDWTQLGRTLSSTHIITDVLLVLVGDSNFTWCLKGNSVILIVTVQNFYLISDILLKLRYKRRAAKSDLSCNIATKRG